MRLITKVDLREFEIDDWKAVHAYASQDIVSQYAPWGPNSSNDSKGFVEQVVKDAKQDPRIRYALAVVENETGSLIGASEINIRDVENRSGEISYIIHPDYWGRGIATTVAAKLIELGFKQLNLHRVFATCDPRNVGSARVLEKVGMVKEGVIRDDILIKDGWRDSALYSLLEQEYYKLKGVK
ncbi:GNAT family N-acetyltransferase [Aquibacillus halophilus]|uniref:GNAT family N-acetyltransferase n=1 Tax=Aquibacillus halophilus TaxID=930132 RepID=A0A6A8DIM0_9BACI|nr:GNAT family protein [Aquibacillus halophilus]MRH45100.1 GNAT family N-acetyltransferase [Aquibacillus halophilus]